jgi:hypothetical protein
MSVYTDVYRLRHQWLIEGPIETVFHYVTDARTFLDWFPVFKEVSVDEPVGPLHVGSHATARVKALLPYVLDWDITVVRYEPPVFQETSVVLSLSGRFRMHGYIRYSFEERHGNMVLVRNEQELAAEKPLPPLLHPLAQAAFAFNHRHAMGEAQAPLQAIVRAKPTTTQ